MKNKKNVIIAVMIAVALSMATGYAYFATQLNINATGNITSSWNVHFASITNGTAVGGASNVTTPSISGTSANMNVNLNLPGDSMTYNIVLKNSGSIGAIVEDINGETSGTNAIVYSITGINIGDKLAAGASKTITVKIEYDSSITGQPSLTYKTVNLNVSCVQDIGQTITTSPVIEATIPASEASVGDYVNYNAGVSGYTGTWRVIGVDDGKLKLLSTESIGNLTLSGKNGYLNAINRLNEMASPYQSGVGAESARSVTAEDINELMGYDRSKEKATGLPYNFGNDAEYGISIDYQLEGTNVIFRGSNGIVSYGNSTSTSFRKLENGATLAAGETYNIKNNYYSYKLYKYATSDYEMISSTLMQMKISELQNGLIIPMNVTSGRTSYWLANESVLGKIWSASWGIMHLANDSASVGVQNSGIIGREYLYNSNPSKADGSYTRGVRAVVLLDETTKLKSSSTTHDQISTAWQIIS